MKNKKGSAWGMVVLIMLMGVCLFHPLTAHAAGPKDWLIIGETFDPGTNIDLIAKGTLIETRSFVDESGEVVIERTYYKPKSGTATDVMSVNGEVSIMATSGNGWITKEHSYPYNSDMLTYYVRGYFVWGNGDVSVSGASSGCSNIPKGVTVTDIQRSSGVGNYAWVFNKFAYVSFSCTSYSNIAQKKHSHSLTLRISQSGNNI